MATTLITPIQERQLLRADRHLAPTFHEWTQRTTPQYSWHWPHIRLLQDTLERVTLGELRRVIIEMPPRHGKSETATVRYPVYRLHEDPTLRVIIGAYNSTFAERFGRFTRKSAINTGLELSEERATAGDWETTSGGGVRTVGVGSGVTGTGGDLIIIDDPVKSREEAESPTYRDRVWSWYTDDLYTRLEPSGALIVIMTRWHHDDLVGRILASEDAGSWHRLTLPALAEPNDPLGRPVGAALCPDRYDEVALKERQVVLGEYGFSALFQQRPTPRSGNMFPRDKVTFLDAPPAGIRWVRYWDKAGTQDGGKRTAGVRMGVHDGRVIIADSTISQLGSERRNALMRTTAELDGGGVSVWVEQEPGSGGKESAELSVKLLAGFSVHIERVTGDKVVRADPFAAQWQAGNVTVIRGPWNKAYLDELELFPSGAYSDQTDASSGAYNKLTLAPIVRVRSLN